MVQISVSDSVDVPIYQQIVDQITRAIVSGSIAPGYQLPTVRGLAVETGISQGTIKHAYDMMEQLGLIKKARGSGTFVNIPRETKGEGSKVQAMQAIDTFLDRMQELSFSPHDVRIYLDLKLREREEQVTSVTVAAVDCCPETLSAMSAQLMRLPHTELTRFLLEDVLRGPNRFEPAADLVVTTPTHFGELSQKMSPGAQPARLVMAIATGTALDLAAIPGDARLGIACASRRFAQLILTACGQYCKLNNPIAIAYFKEGESLSELVKNCDRLIIPPDYTRFVSPEEDLILRSCMQSHKPIQYGYHGDRGSLLYLEDEVNRLYRANQGKL
ncbi:transcriptional regulator, GntR family protein [Treponema primitia ZAS-2]|uniref:Transcriptional regulator, GntR family protein n=1 Tax=Treponema primitia (strain ATCC BAA-887 / DSM 12427 / ZAS-2) TaxID=545694 RepID=F5YRD6_TREPZ|nr:GntR family transcriptional regulator [Treponema primitia]AEF83903.1 transcriptional regulator, GntR family protein [Treponema primitia ZAS-2]